MTSQMSPLPFIDLQQSTAQIICDCFALAQSGKAVGVAGREQRLLFSVYLAAYIEEQIDSLPPVVMLRVRNMTTIDATGLHALEDLANKLRRTGRTLILCGMREQPARLMGQTEFHRHLGDNDIQPSLADGIARAREILSGGHSLLSKSDPIKMEENTKQEPEAKHAESGVSV
jgi:anti-anti-sigma regulatory factor